MRVALLAIVVCAVAALVASVVLKYHSDAHGELEAATDRIAGALARGDHAALAADPLLAGRPELLARLQPYETVLASGYRVRVSRNGSGYEMAPAAQITHVGAAETALGTLRLGFHRSTGELALVTITFTITD